MAPSALREIRRDGQIVSHCPSTVSWSARAGEIRSGTRPSLTWTLLNFRAPYALDDCSPTLTQTLSHRCYGVGHESTDLGTLTDALGCTAGRAPAAAMPPSEHADSALWCQESLESTAGSILQGQDWLDRQLEGGLSSSEELPVHEPGGACVHDAPPRRR